MPYTGGEYSQQSLLKELKHMIAIENVKSFDQYSELVDWLIEEKKSYGFLSDEEDLTQLRRDLELRWREIAH
jgi:hypothetical protein